MPPRITYSDFDHDLMQMEVEVTLLRLGCGQPVAADYAAAVLNTIRRTNEGNTVYFSRRSTREYERVKAQFRAEYNSRNRKELCQKYGISKRTVYRWLKS